MKDHWGFLADHAARAARRDERPGSRRREAAMEAMMTMKIIDIATIEAARAQGEADE